MSKVLNDNRRHVHPASTRLRFASRRRKQMQPESKCNFSILAGDFRKSKNLGEEILSIPHYTLYNNTSTQLKSNQYTAFNRAIRALLIASFFIRICLRVVI